MYFRPVTATSPASVHGPTTVRRPKWRKQSAPDSAPIGPLQFWPQCLSAPSLSRLFELHGSLSFWLHDCRSQRDFRDRRPALICCGQRHVVLSISIEYRKGCSTDWRSTPHRRFLLHVRRNNAAAYGRQLCLFGSRRALKLQITQSTCSSLNLSRVQTTKLRTRVVTDRRDAITGQLGPTVED
jgi:hypothetical protein